MNKIKELWGKNKVLIVLGFILLICVIAIVVVTVSFFFGGNKSSYGNRLEDIDKHPVTEKFQNEYIKKLEEDEKVKKAKMEITGRIIYVIIDYVEDTKLSDAEAVVALSMENFDEDILGYYDISFTLRCAKGEKSEGFTILGARNASGSGLHWNNNTPLESEEK